MSGTDKKYPPRNITSQPSVRQSGDRNYYDRNQTSPNADRYATYNHRRSPNSPTSYGIGNGHSYQTEGSSSYDPAYRKSSAKNYGHKDDGIIKSPRDYYKNDENKAGNTKKSNERLNTSESNADTSFDRRLSNSIAVPSSSADKLNQSGDSLNRSYERKLSNSISIPGLFDYENKKHQNKSPKKKSNMSGPEKPKSSPRTPKKLSNAESLQNIDTTGEKARLISVRRLDNPDEQRTNRSLESSGSSSNLSDSDSAPDVFLPKRYMLALMMFLGFVNMYAIRVNLNVAIGAMVNNHTLIKGGVAFVEPPEFDWSSRLQGVVLGSFYYGYMLLQIPGGYFAMRYGGTKIFGGAIFLASVLTLLTPIATRLSVWSLVGLRVLEGLVLGVMLPCNHQIWSSWAPLQERTTLVTIALAGMNVGTVVTMPLTGLLTKYGFDGGWASVFYCFGAFGILWSILWMFIVHATPDAHPTISEKERKYINKNVLTRKSMNIPWKAIFLSKPVWGIIIGNVANDWGLYTILICLPLFLMDIMKFNIQTMGFIASLPFLLKAIMGPIGGVVADILRYKYISTGNARKIFYAIGAMSAAVMIVIAGYSNSPSVAVLSMCIGVAMSGLLHSGYEVNVLDIAPCLSGIVMGISNTAGTTTGFLSPLLVGIMTENKLRSEWITVFWITFSIYLIGTILFCWLCSGEAQHWAVDEDDKEDDTRPRRN